jgi:NAD(P)-dependent dehydrogenase (short-subunit alcohol dehydrogenase family)
MPDLSGKVAIVTGAGRGIGREHALALARAGARVVVNDLGVSVAGEGGDEGPAHDVVTEIEALGGQAIANGENVADFAGARRLVEQAIEHVDRLDILVNNAGILRDRMLVDMEEIEWDAVIDVHLKGHFAPTRHAATYWRERSKASPDPANNSPIVVALCADEAQEITGQVFFVYGGVVNMLRGWEAGELFSAGESRWDPDALLRELRERLPHGAAPAGMLDSMHAVGGRSMRE